MRTFLCTAATLLHLLGTASSIDAPSQVKAVSEGDVDTAATFSARLYDTVDEWYHNSIGFLNQILPCKIFAHKPRRGLP
jgi:hypothetical protein